MAQQNLDFNIAANVKGMEAIATLINRVGALEAETKRLASANATLSSSTDAVIRNGVRYNNALDAQSKELRNARQGTQQLGMQINDFATSVSSGTSVQQAFTQQLGQVGYAMSMMGGTAGRIGSFLSGPWGAAILIGAMALGPLITKLWETVSGANAAEGALASLAKRRQAMIEKERELPNAEKELAGLIKRRGQLEEDIRKRGVRDSQGRLMFVYREQKELEEVKKQIADARANIDFGRTEKFNLGLDTVMRDLNKPREAASKATGGGGAKGGSSALNDAEKARERAQEIEMEIARIRFKGDQALNDEFTKMSEDQNSKLQETLKHAEEMAIASAQTLSDKAIKPFMTQLDELNTSYARIGGTVADAFKGMLTGAMSWKDGMKSIINSVIDELWRLYVVQQIVGLVTNFLGGIGLPIPQVAGARANGGPVSGNKPYLVGERGPEIVVPGKSGTVIPNRGIGGMGSGMVINVDARGSADPAAVRAQVQQGIIEAAPSIIAAAEARTVQGLRRPRLGGAIK